MDTIGYGAYTGWMDPALLLVRVVVGGLLMGHGAQKLFGWFGGHGLAGTGGWLESMGMRPGWIWATTAGLGEFGGGLLLALGFLSPLGSIMIVAVMAMAWAKTHWGKPIWVTEGGAELPLVNMAAALAIALGGPGRISVDHALGIRTPFWLVALVAAGAAASVVLGAMMKPAPAEPGLRAVPREEEEAPEERRVAA